MKYAAPALLICVVVFVVLQVRRANDTYRYASTRTALENFGKALQEYHRVHGRLGRSLTLRDVDPALPTIDAWRNGFVLVCEDQEFQLSSLGSDSRSGGTDAAQDIVVRWKAGQKDLHWESAPLSP